MEEKKEAFGRLLDIMDELREQCPWDKKQTIESLRHLTIEETYELADAIIEKDMNALKGELGDLFLHIVFYARIASETSDFDIKDVLDEICEKLVRRHPHIYGDVKVKDAEDVKKNWEKIKLTEDRNSVLEGVPGSLPAMVKANRIQDKVRGIGFDWDDAIGPWDKVQEELGELKQEIDQRGSAQRIESEFGDVLFSLINYARFIGVNPDDALERTNKKFIKRFKYIEAKTKAEGKELEKMSLEEMDVYWNEAKKDQKL